MNAMTDFEDAGLYIPLYYTLASALDYLKGMDLSPERFSHTADFFGPPPEEWLAQLAMRETVADTPLIQISPTILRDAQDALDERGLDAHSEEYPEYSIQNQKPLDEDDADVCPIG